VLLDLLLLDLLLQKFHGPLYTRAEENATPGFVRVHSYCG
jgi:hypothetical protein